MPKIFYHFQIYVVFFLAFSAYFSDITHKVITLRRLPTQNDLLYFAMSRQTFFHKKYQTIVVSFWQWRTLTKRTICRRGFNPVVMIVYFFFIFVTQITCFSVYILRIVFPCYILLLLLLYLYVRRSSFTILYFIE